MVVMVFSFLCRAYLPSFLPFCVVGATLNAHIPPGCLRWLAFARGCGSGRLSIRGALARGALEVAGRMPCRYPIDTWISIFQHLGSSLVHLYLLHSFSKNAINHYQIWLHGATQGLVYKHPDLPDLPEIVRRVCNVWKLNCRV